VHQPVRWCFIPLCFSAAIQHILRKEWLDDSVAAGHLQGKDQHVASASAALIHDSLQSSSDEAKYALHDVENEKKFHFSIKDSLARNGTSFRATI